jgi:hypothetical protein
LGRREGGYGMRRSKALNDVVGRKVGRLEFLIFWGKLVS